MTNLKSSLLLMGMISSLLIACQDHSRPADQQEGVMQKEDTVSHQEAAHAEQATPVSLNNGQKWEANAETTEGIKKMTMLVEKFPVQADPQDYPALSAKLESEFNLIIQKCTMTGEAHQQLHNFLLPMRPMIDNLKSRDPKVCSESLAELKDHLKEYGNYFK